MDYNFYGNWIKEHRKRRKMSQDDLAAEVGISRSMLSLFERGRNFPMVDVWEQIVDVLGGEIIVREREGFEYEADYE